MERLADAALREYPVIRVTAGLKGDDAGHVGFHRKNLKIEHQLHMFREGIRHACWRVRQSALFAALVIRFDHLDAPFDLANRIEIPFHSLAIGRTQLRLNVRKVALNPVEDAAPGSTTIGAILSITSGAK